MKRGLVVGTMWRPHDLLPLPERVETVGGPMAKRTPSPSDPLFEGLTYGRAWNAFWLGLLSVFCCGFFTGVPAIFVGAQALSEIEASDGRLMGRGTAWVGVILGVLGTLITGGVAGYAGTRWGS
jgi:hypothetical protein